MRAAGPVCSVGRSSRATGNRSGNGQYRMGCGKDAGEARSSKKVSKDLGGPVPEVVSPSVCLFSRYVRRGSALPKSLGDRGGAHASAMVMELTKPSARAENWRDVSDMHPVDCRERFSPLGVATTAEFALQPRASPGRFSLGGAVRTAHLASVPPMSGK